MEKKILNTVIIVGSVFLIGLFLYRAQTVISTFAVAFFISYLLSPAVDWAEQRKIPRTVTILTLFLLMTAGLTVLFTYAVPVLYNEAVKLVDMYPLYAVRIAEALDPYLVNVSGMIPGGSVKSFLLEHASELGGTAADITGRLISGINNVLVLTAFTALIPVLVFYYLRDFKQVSDNLLATVSVRWTNAPEMVARFNRLLSIYFRGQVVVCICLGIMYTVVLLVIGIQGGIIVGLVAGALSIVPYLGFITGFITSLILAYAQYADALHPLMVVVGFLIVQGIEGYVITPRIIGKSLGLHPTVVIFSLLSGGAVMGIAGMIFALPLAAFIRVAVNEYVRSGFTETPHSD